MRLVDHLYFVAEHDDHHLAKIWNMSTVSVLFLKSLEQWWPERQPEEANRPPSRKVSVMGLSARIGSSRFGLLGFFGVAAQIQDQTHDQVLELVTHLLVNLLAAPDRIFDFPLTDLDRHPRGKLLAADIHDHIQHRHINGSQILWVLSVDIDILSLHHLFGKRLNDGSRREAGALRLKNIRSVSPGKSFRHLTAERFPMQRKRTRFTPLSLADGTIRPFRRDFVNKVLVNMIIGA